MSNNTDINDAINSSVGSPIKRAVDSVYDSINRNIESRDLLQKYEKTQKKHVRTQLENINLLGMSTPIPLEKIYYPAQVSTGIRRRLYEQEWLSESGTASKRDKKSRNGKDKCIDASEYVLNNRKVIILGGPGAGKTTLLRFLALLNSGAIDTNEKIENSLPFFIHLPHFVKSDKNLFDYICRPLTKATDQYAADFIKRTFNKGTSIVLLDSLDEVPLPMRHDLIEKIKEFEVSYPILRIIVSCRTADYEEVLPNFCEVEISRLSRDAIGKIVRAWFDDDSQKASKLISLIKEDNGVASLTETPLLLSLLCIQYRHDLQLPKRKTELYRRCLDTLLRDWDAERGFRRETAYENISDDRKERLFEHIAGKFFIEDNAYEFKKDHMLSVVDDFLERVDVQKVNAEDLVDEIERHHGIIEKLSQDYFCFSHASMQDYFVARHMLSKRIESEKITKNIENESWHPVIEFTIALSGDPTAILDLLIKKSTMEGLSNFPPMARRTKILMLLYRAMSSSPFISRDMSNKCFSHLISSQITMANIFKSGKIIPFAEFGPSGVRHVLFYMERPRPTLGEALQPYRKFSNLIAATPMRDYATACFNAVDELLEQTKGQAHMLLDEALLINLITPLGGTWPPEVLSRLNIISERSSLSFIKNIISKSKSYIETKAR